MHTEHVTIPTADGAAPATLFHPDGSGPWPAILFFMDGPGIRPSMEQMASRLASNGYWVLLPNLYYRAGAIKPFNGATVFTDPEERTRVMSLIGSMTRNVAMRDTDAYLRFIEEQPSTKRAPIGVVGYCLGGRLALLAAGTYPGRIAAVASIHGGRIGSDDPDSPLHLVPKMKARLYIGVAKNDNSHTPEMNDRLVRALDAAGTNYRLEHYDALHGWSTPDMPVYDEKEAERHWKAVTALFAETL